MNANCLLTENSFGDFDCNWEFQMENMATKLIDEPEYTSDSNSNEDENENVFNFDDMFKDDKSPISSQGKENFSTLSSSSATNTKFQRSNVKFSTFTGQANFKNEFILDSSKHCPMQLPQSSCCLYGYSLYDNSSIRQMPFQKQKISMSKETKIDLLLNQVHTQLAQYDQITIGMYQILKNNFVDIIKSQKGSRLFQNYLKKTDYSIIYMIYQELQYDLVSIINDMYSNYFFTKFYSCLHKKDRIEIISIIANSFIELSCNSIGAFPIQSMIEQAHTKIEKNLISKIVNNNINTLCKDPYGCHVIAKMISCFERKYIEPIFNYIISNLPTLTQDPNGICVIKTFITYIAEQYTIHQDLYFHFYNFLINDFVTLIHNKYGNQVLKTVVQLWNVDIIKNLLMIIQSNSIELSIGKFSSTIIEALLEKNSFFLETYIQHLLNNNMLFELMCNNFGKYVIQKALKLSSGQLRNFLLKYIVNNYFNFPDMKIQSQWKNILDQYSLIV